MSDKQLKIIIEENGKVIHMSICKNILATWNVQPGVTCTTPMGEINVPEAVKLLAGNIRGFLEVCETLGESPDEAFKLIDVAQQMAMTSKVDEMLESLKEKDEELFTVLKSLDRVIKKRMV